MRSPTGIIDKTNLTDHVQSHSEMCNGLATCSVPVPSIWSKILDSGSRASIENDSSQRDSLIPYYANSKSETIGYHLTPKS